MTNIFSNFELFFLKVWRILLIFCCASPCPNCIIPSKPPVAQLEFIIGNSLQSFKSVLSPKRLTRINYFRNYRIKSHDKMAVTLVLGNHHLIGFCQCAISPKLQTSTSQKHYILPTPQHFLCNILSPLKVISVTVWNAESNCILHSCYSPSSLKAILL